MLKYLHASNGDKTPIPLLLSHVSPATLVKQAICISETPPVYVWPSGIQWLFHEPAEFFTCPPSIKGHSLTKYSVRPEVSTNFNSQDDCL